jgi:hypothetical protein
MYSSKVFSKISTEELISIIYSFYQSHAGTIYFFKEIEEDLNLKLNDKLSTIDLLRVL